MSRETEEIDAIKRCYEYTYNEHNNSQLHFYSIHLTHSSGWVVHSSFIDKDIFVNQSYLSVERSEVTYGSKCGSKCHFMFRENQILYFVENNHVKYCKILPLATRLIIIKIF